MSRRACTAALTASLFCVSGCPGQAPLAGEDAAAVASSDASAAGLDGSAREDAAATLADAAARDAGAAGEDASAAADATEPEDVGAGLDASGPADAEADLDAASLVPDGSAPPAAKRGTADLMQLCMNDAGCFASVMTDFREWAAWPFPGCSQTTLGGCEVTECSFGFDAGSPPTPPQRSAGVVVVDGTRFDGGLSLNTADSGSGMHLFPNAGRVWEPGDVLTVSATGDVVPAFSGRSVTVPGDIVVTAPACTGSGCGSFSRAAPLTIAWTGGATATVTLIASKAGERFVTFQCRFDSSPATIDAALMAKLGAPDGGFSNNLFITPRDTNTFAAGDWTITVSVTGIATNGSGSFATSD